MSNILFIAMIMIIIQYNIYTNIYIIKLDSY